MSTGYYLSLNYCFVFPPTKIDHLWMNTNHFLNEKENKINDAILPNYILILKYNISLLMI